MSYPVAAVPYRLPDTCPICGAAAKPDEDGVFIRCTGVSCPAQLSRNIAHFVSRDAMDIDGLGAAIVDGLIENGHIKRLYPTIDHIIPLSKGGTHTWNNVQLAHMCCNAGKCDKVDNTVKREEVWT